jgi:hypothetical protein
MKKLGGPPRIAGMALTALLLFGFTVHPGASGTVQRQTMTENPRRTAGIDFSLRSHVLDPVRLVEVVGDSSDGGGGNGIPQYCYDAYQRCLADCNSLSLGWGILGFLSGPFGSSISYSLTFGCSTGCGIGLASCG